MNFVNSKKCGGALLLALMALAGCGGGANSASTATTATTTTAVTPTFADIRAVLDVATTDGTGAVSGSTGCMGSSCHSSGGAATVMFGNIDRDGDGLISISDEAMYFKQIKSVGIDTTSANNSWLLLRPSGSGHMGLKRAGFDTTQVVGSAGRSNYDLFLAWIVAGAPYSAISSTPPTATCLTNCSGTLSITHAAGDPAAGEKFWKTTGACAGCHDITPSDKSFSAGYAGTGGPYKKLAYYASKPANIKAGLDAVTSANMLPFNVSSIANQDNLSAYLASLMTPVLAAPGNSAWVSGAAYSYQIGAPADADYLVSTTTYSVSAPGLMLTVSPTGLVTGTLPTTTAPTDYTVTLSATNAAATTGGSTGSVSFTLTVGAISGTIPVDTTPPTIMGTSPAANSTGVVLNSVITANVSEALAAASVDTSTFTLNNGVTGTVTFSGSTATFTPSSNLAYATTYTATISSSVTDLAGNHLASDYTWSFTTLPDMGVVNTPVTTATTFADIRAVLDVVATDGTGAVAGSTGCMGSSCHSTGGAAMVLFGNIDRNADGQINAADDAIYFNLIKSTNVNTTTPSNSWLLLRPSGSAHMGLNRSGFDTTQVVGAAGRSNYDLFLAWIVAGAPYSATSATPPVVPCLPNCNGTLSTTHAAGDPVRGEGVWVDCKVCHPGNLGMFPTPSAPLVGYGVWAWRTVWSTAAPATLVTTGGPFNTTMYYATNPANFTAGLNATTHTAMLSWNAWSIANQDDLSAYFASFRTPELINPGNSTWASGAAYSYQISAPLTADYLVSTTTYNVSAGTQTVNGPIALPLSVSATGLVTGTLPIVTTPTTYSVYIYVRNMPPGGTPVMMTQGSVSYTLTVQ